MFLKIRNKFYWGYRGEAPISKQSPLPVWEGGMGDGVVNFAKCKIKNSYAVILVCAWRKKAVKEGLPRNARQSLRTFFIGTTNFLYQNYGPEISHSVSETITPP